MNKPIRSIPLLTGKVAEDFVKEAEYNSKYKKHSIDFSQEAENGKKILEKARNKGKNV